MALIVDRVYRGFWSRKSTISDGRMLEGRYISWHLAAAEQLPGVEVQLPNISGRCITTIRDRTSFWGAWDVTCLGTRYLDLAGRLSLRLKFSQPCLWTVVLHLWRMFRHIFSANNLAWLVLWLCCPLWTSSRTMIGQHTTLHLRRRCDERTFCIRSGNLKKSSPELWDHPWSAT